jgi:LCP family protein required for cell wall assembly
MADDRQEDTPEYTLYRARPRFLRGRDEPALGDLGGGGGGRDGRGRGNGRGPGGGDDGRDRPDYDVHGRRRGFSFRRTTTGKRRRLTPGRIVKWVASAVALWLLVSLVLFLVSAQVESAKVPDSAKQQLSGGGFPLTSPQTVLVLGTDARPEGSHEAGATILGSNGPQRSDTIMLLRIGGGKNAQLSVLRDTIVNIPGHGETKINAAYAYGGPALTIKTVEQYLGIPINHLILVNFANFPALVDAMGGITYTGSCVHSELNGGKANGGFTLKLKRGTHHLNGKQALALARTRHNLCNPAEDDRTRVARQQKILTAIKGRVTSPSTFFRLPWVSWAAPKAVQSDMAGPGLLGLVGAELLGGEAHRQVLQPSAFVTLPDGESALRVDDADKRAAVARFLKG